MKNKKPLIQTGDKPKIALVVAAHPDDAEFGCGGSSALLVQQGWQVHYLIITNGAKGTDNPKMKSQTLIKIRQKEQINAGKEIGIASCSFLKNEDGELEYTRKTLGDIVKTIRTVKPYAVFTHSTDFLHHRPLTKNKAKQQFEGWVNHRDHRKTAQMTIDAVYPSARDRLNFPTHLTRNKLETHKTTELFLWGAHNANFEVTITSVLDIKINALKQHTSQISEQNLKHIEQRMRALKKETFHRLVLQ